MISFKFKYFTVFLKFRNEVVDKIVVVKNGKVQEDNLIIDKLLGMNTDDALFLLGSVDSYGSLLEYLLVNDYKNKVPSINTYSVEAKNVDIQFICSNAMLTSIYLTFFNTKDEIQGYGRIGKYSYFVTDGKGYQEQSKLQVNKLPYVGSLISMYKLHTSEEKVKEIISKQNWL